MVVYLSARCLLSFAMENTSRARHRRPLNCADLYGPQTSRPLRLQQRVLSRRLKDDGLATVDTAEDGKPSPRCHASLTSSLFLPSCPRCSLPSGPVSVTRYYLPCAPVSVTAVTSLVFPSASLTACLGKAAVLDWVLVLLGRGVFISLPFFLLVRRLSSFILLCCLYNITGSTLKRSVFKKSFKKEAFCSLLLIVKTQMRVWYHWWKKGKQQKQKTKTSDCGEDFYDLKFSFYNYWTLFVYCCDYYYFSFTKLIKMKPKRLLPEKKPTRWTI